MPRYQLPRNGRRFSILFDDSKMWFPQSATTKYPKKLGQARHTRRQSSTHIRFAFLWYHKNKHRSFVFNQKLRSFSTKNQDLSNHARERVAETEAHLQAFRYSFSDRQATLQILNLPRGVYEIHTPGTDGGRSCARDPRRRG